VGEWRSGGVKEWKSGREEEREGEREMRGEELLPDSQREATPALNKTRCVVFPVDQAIKGLCERQRERERGKEKRGISLPVIHFFLSACTRVFLIKCKIMNFMCVCLFFFFVRDE